MVVSLLYMVVLFSQAIMGLKISYLDVVVDSKMSIWLRLCASCSRMVIPPK